MRRGAACLVVLAACGAPAPRADRGPLPANAIARCGTEVVTVADASRADPRALIADACFANEAERRGYADEPSVRRATTAALARAVLEDLARNESGPATAAELARVRAAHFQQIDRPEGARVVHAVAIADEKDATKRAQAKEIATRIAAATRGSTSIDDFKSRVNSVAHDGVEVRIEDLPPVAADGRVLEGDGEFAAPFAAAATSLQNPNDEVGPIATEFGWHVLHLVERTPAHRLDDDELRALATDEILANRRRQALADHLAELRRQSPPAIERSVDELFSHLDPPRR